MKKKIIPMIIIGILFLSGFGAAVDLGEQTYIDYHKDTNGFLNSGDELDQNQSLQDYTLSIGWFSDTIGWNMSAAQSFIPTLPLLTRVKLLISSTGENVPTKPYMVGIKTDLTGENLTKIGVSPDEISENLSWVEFDFSDITVDVGQTYYIVSYTSNVSGNEYSWGWQSTDVYPNGTCYWRTKVADEFDDLSSDMAFKTYGMESTELDIEFIKSGLSVSVAVENIGDYEAVDIEWSVNITGGIFGLINEYIEGDAATLPSGDDMAVELPTLFGLGPLQIVTTALAVNADEVTETWDGLIIFIFVF